jgi:hypothetical protein
VFGNPRPYLISVFFHRQHARTSADTGTGGMQAGMAALLQHAHRSSYCTLAVMTVASGITPAKRGTLRIYYWQGDI